MENKYSDYIMEILRQRQDLEANDTSMDEEINNMSKAEAFDEVCMWEGLIGYGDTILNWLEDIYGIDFDSLEN